MNSISQLTIDDFVTESYVKLRKFNGQNECRLYRHYGNTSFVFTVNYHVTYLKLMTNLNHHVTKIM